LNPFGRALWFKSFRARHYAMAQNLPCGDIIKLPAGALGTLLPVASA
jgi:hypothetical protein